MAGRLSKLQFASMSILGRLFSHKVAGTCRVAPVASPTGRFDHILSDPMKNCRRSASSTTSQLYFTALGRCETLDLKKSGYMTLADAFRKQKKRYFANSKDGSNVYCFSNLSIDIFRQVAAVAFDKAFRENKFFRFNASNIILKQEGLNTIVFIPECDIASVEETTIYTDRVVGPLATLMYSVYDVNSNAQAKKYQYKEVLDLLEKSQNGQKWWSTLDHILDHAIFWPVEKKLAAIVSATMRLGTGKSTLKHGIAGTKARQRVHSPQAVINALENFYQKVYTVDFINGEYKVTSSMDTSRDWRVEFKRAFDSKYFGSSTDPVPVKILKFVRHIIVHFPDENFDAYAATLRRKTVAVATIELDRKFSLSLSIYYALRALSKKHLSDILNLPV